MSASKSLVLKHTTYGMLTSLNKMYPKIGEGGIAKLIEDSALAIHIFGAMSLIRLPFVISLKYQNTRWISTFFNIEISAKKYPDIRYYLHDAIIY